MERTLSYLPLPLDVKSKLLQNGFIFASHVDNLDPLQLSHKASLSIEEAELVKEAIEHARKFTRLGSVTSAAALLEEEERSCLDIITFSKAFDTILGGGISLGRVTEVAGEAGVGKTQLCFQLCVDVQIPRELGGCDGESIFIDAEGNFASSRIQSMAEACIEYCRGLAHETNNPSFVTHFTVDSILKKIYCYRCRDYRQLLQVVDLLDRFITNHPQVKLVVIDSIAFNFRHEIEDPKVRTQLLFHLAADLNSICQKFRVAVLITNQMTTKFDEKGEGTLVPALGELWTSATCVRVVLGWENGQRWAQLCKAPHLPLGRAPYRVTSMGIRDV